MTDLLRNRVDDVRRHATELASALGVPPVRAAALVSHLLWFDAAGASRFGIATLPRWLDRIDGHEFDAGATGKVTTERNGTAVLDGRNGLPPLILERAAGIAVEKARDAGVGLVRVLNVRASGPAAVVAAEIAIGPMSAWIVGPGPCWSLALPSMQGLPWVLDSFLGGEANPPPPWAAGLVPWAPVLTPDDGWMILAVAVAAWEPLPLFHARVQAVLKDREESPGALLPGVWEKHRTAVRDRGVPISDDAREGLARWAVRLGVSPIVPASDPELDSH